MNKYILEQSVKTKILNLFRRLLANSFLEKIILAGTLKKSDSIFFKLVPPNYLYKPGSIRKTRREGIQFSFDISHVIDHGIYFGYPEPGYASILDTIKSARTIFDIGANIGSTAMRFANINSEAAIYAFEPHPRTYKRALSNLALNNFPNITMVMKGLGEREGKFKLYEVNEHNPGMNRVITGEYDFPFVEILISTIDRFVAENNITRVDFIKIDVEGFEYSVLKGGEKTLTEFRPCLFIELDNNNLMDNHSSAAQLVAFLKSVGYSRIYRADNRADVSGSYDFTNCHFDIIAI